MSHNRMKDECTECEVECQNEFKDQYANCPCQANCLSGCPCPNYQCSNSTTTTTTSTSTEIPTTTAPMVEKDVLVLSTRNGEKTPMIISFTGENYFTEKQLNIQSEAKIRQFLKLGFSEKTALFWPFILCLISAFLVKILKFRKSEKINWWKCVGLSFSG